ncbi:hypothetical protein BP6252_06654 [Coleophoma cylindrospora]|uniref:Uncharacterized protein n=1 Tax=Coleophoma cylindrospora TaxID=1849047 RepID=A0A3D8RN37_9HELO|nr:hypothetical protein BP6252_06654 [Coleophoma cylindrospora]
MARSQEHWTARIMKHAEGITLTTSKEDLNEYALTKMHVHTEADFTDYTLWMVFKEEFESFTESTFKKLRVDVRAKLRIHLLQRGVYVDKPNAQHPLAAVLHDVLLEEEPHDWTDDELAAALKEVSPLITIALRDRLNPMKDRLRTQTAQSPPQSPPLPPLPPDTPLSSPTPPDRRPRGSGYDILQELEDQIEMLKKSLKISNGGPITTPDSMNFSKEATAVAKIYTNNQKYDGVNNRFDLKLNIFYDICRRANLPPTSYMAAFPTMLKGLAQDHYYNNNLSSRTFIEPADTGSLLLRPHCLHYLAVDGAIEPVYRQTLVWAVNIVSTVNDKNGRNQTVAKQNWF